MFIKAHNENVAPKMGLVESLLRVQNQNGSSSEEQECAQQISNCLVD